MFWPFSSKRSDGQISDSHIGGEVVLPTGMAEIRCLNCKSLMPLFFKISLSNTSQFKEFYLLMFACASCVQEDQLIPEMLSGPLKGRMVKSDFLRAYQRNFRCLLLHHSAFSSGIKIVSDINAVSLEITKDGEVFAGKKLFGKVGGQPNWELEDESPGLCESETPFEFVFQVSRQWPFEISKDAPGQMVLDWLGGGEPFRRETRRYDLFIGNTVYFFATTHDGGLVYILTQVD